MTRFIRTISRAAVSVVAAALLQAAPAGGQTPLFEVEKSDATKLLQVNDDAGFVLKGAAGAGTIPATGAGVRFMWYPKKAALRAGKAAGTEWEDPNVGEGSVALGLHSTASGGSSLAAGSNSMASGPASVAVGSATTASGRSSVAMGAGTIASGATAVALGDQTTASGYASTAMGFGTAATGDQSTAMGNQTKAVGQHSVALGTGVTAQGAGSFAFGDLSTNFPVTAGTNEFLVRAFGGIGLNSGANIGCDLPASTGAWACTSSRLAKERFEDVDGEDVLTRLAQIPIQRWRYRGTEATHLGPTAEDFHAAFGLGESATKIATLDASGISLLGVQALERRTTELQATNAALQAETTELRRRLEALEISGRGR